MGSILMKLAAKQAHSCLQAALERFLYLQERLDADEIGSPEIRDTITSICEDELGDLSNWLYGMEQEEDED